MAQPVIETRNISKNFGSLAAVKDVSLSVEKGEIYAFLGLNGAGKTTTIRMLLGMVKPTAGGANVLGEPILPGKTAPWDRVGYLVEVPHAYPELTVHENLEAVRRLRPGVPPRAVEQMIEQLTLSEYAHRRAGTLSLGNAQRLGLARAMLHQPSVLILDEPANGLDPAGIVEVRDMLRNLAKERGVTIFISSHILGEVTRLADRIGIIHKGELLQELSAIELQQRRRTWLRVRTRNNLAAEQVLVELGCRPTVGTNSIIVTEKSFIDQPDEIAAVLVQAGHPPVHLAVEQEDLEDYFLRLVGDELSS